MVEDYDVEENEEYPDNNQISYIGQDLDNDQIPYIDQDPDNGQIPDNDQDLEAGNICYLRPMKITTRPSSWKPPSRPIRWCRAVFEKKSNCQ